MADPTHMKALQDIYAAIDSEIEGQVRGDRSCPDILMSPQQRVRFDPQPFLLEVDLIHAFLRQHGRTWPSADPDDLCPFNEAGCCTVYEVRPFECRVATAGTMGHRWKVTIERVCSEHARSEGRRLAGYPICMYGMRTDQHRTAVPDST